VRVGTRHYFAFVLYRCLRNLQLPEASAAAVVRKVARRYFEQRESYDAELADVLRDAPLKDRRLSYLTKAWILGALDVSDSEARELRSLLTPAVKAEREQEQAEHRRAKASRRARQRELVAEALRESPAASLRAVADKAGCSHELVRRVKAELGIRSRRRGRPEAERSLFSGSG